MARIRTIKPEAFVSESLAEVSLTAERTFFGLLTQVDDSGRIRDNAAILHGAIWPLRPSHSAADVEEDLRQLEKQDLICRYAGADGKRYLHLPTFGAHQKISHPTPSRMPCCPRHEGPPEGPRPGSGNPPEDSGNAHESSGGSPEIQAAGDAPKRDVGNRDATQAADLGESDTSADTSGISGNSPEDSGISQPHARARARAPEVEVEVEVELGKGELRGAPVALFDPPATVALAPTAPAQPEHSAGTLVAEWVDSRPGNRPPGRTIGHAGKELRILLDEDHIPYEIVRAGFMAWARKGCAPSAIASFVNEAQAAAARGLLPGQRASTTDQRVADALALAAELRAEEQAALGAVIPIDFTARRELTA